MPTKERLSRAAARLGMTTEALIKTRTMRAAVLFQANGALGNPFPSSVLASLTPNPKAWIQEARDFKGQETLWYYPYEYKKGQHIFNTAATAREYMKSKHNFNAAASAQVALQTVKSNLMEQRPVHPQTRRTIDNIIARNSPKPTHES